MPYQSVFKSIPPWIKILLVSAIQARYFLIQQPRGMHTKQNCTTQFNVEHIPLGKTTDMELYWVITLPPGTALVLFFLLPFISSHQEDVNSPPLLLSSCWKLSTTAPFLFLCSFLSITLSSFAIASSIFVITPPLPHQPPQPQTSTFRHFLFCSTFAFASSQTLSHYGAGHQLVSTHTECLCATSYHYHVSPKDMIMDHACGSYWYQ